MYPVYTACSRDILNVHVHTVFITCTCTCGHVFPVLQVLGTLATAEDLLGDLDGYKPFYREAIELKDELYDYQREQFDGWSRQTLGAIDSKAGSLSLETSGRLMELGKKDGKLVVHYSDKLVTLLREVRQLLAFGFPVSAKIHHVANTAQKFYRHAIVLKRVSVLYPWFKEVCEYVCSLHTSIHL